MTTKTLSINISNNIYPVSYSWDSDCDLFMMYSQKTGTLNSNSTIITDVTYNENLCLDCNFTFSINNGIDCFGSESKQLNLSCGNLIMSNNCSCPANVILDGGNSCSSLTGNPCILQDIPFGIHNLEIESFCLPAITTINANGQTQTGNGTFFFTVVTDINNPTIQININC